jgi:hypothetical protein
VARGAYETASEVELKAGSLLDRPKVLFRDLYARDETA